MAQPTYRSVTVSRRTSRFGMNQVRFLAFDENRKYLLTEGLKSCFVVFLVSHRATVAAHIPPNPGTSPNDLTAGDKNLVAKMREFAGLYNANKDKYFTNCQVALVFATIEGKSPMPDKKHFIEQCLRQFKVDFPMQDYKIKPRGMPRREEDGTAFVDGSMTDRASVYVEDRLLLRVMAPAQSQQTFSNPIFKR